MKKTLRLVLGDQLNQQHSWFKNSEKHVSYVLMELRSETDYTQHHIQKVVSFFLAMQSFAEDIKTKEELSAEQNQMMQDQQQNDGHQSLFRRCR